MHRDIKPQNVFLCRHVVAGEVAKVVDFGISKIRRSQSQMTRDHMILGTPHYMSPEAARGQHSQIDGRADQFALGVILYRALSGRMPFDGDEMMAVLYQVVHEAPPPLRALVPGLPAGVAQAIERTLAKRKENRFPSMDEFLIALQTGAAAQEVPRTLVGHGGRYASASPPSWGARGRRPLGFLGSSSVALAMDSSASR